MHLVVIGQVNSLGYSSSDANDMLKAPLSSRQTDLSNAPKKYRNGPSSY